MIEKKHMINRLLKSINTKTLRGILSNFNNKTVCGLAFVFLSWFFFAPSFKFSHTNTTSEIIPIITEEKTLQPSSHYQSQLKATTKETLTSPFKGTITSILKNYGDTVQSGDCIIKIHAQETQETLIDTAFEVIKAKHKLAQLKHKVQSNQSLHKLGTLSENDYLESQTTYHEHQLSLFKLQNKLHQLCQKANLSPDTIEKLSLADEKGLKQFINTPLSFCIKANESGILLAGDQTNDDTKTPSLKSLLPGKPVEAEQVLAIVGDINTLEANIILSDQDIQTVKPGMPAVIKGLDNDLQSNPATVISVNRFTKVNHQQNQTGYPAAVSVHCPQPTCNFHIGNEISVQIDQPTTRVVEIPHSALSRTTPPTIQVKTPDGWTPRQVTVVSSNQHGVVVNPLNPGETIARDHPNAPSQ